MILSRYERMIARRYLLPGKGEGFIFVVAAFSFGAVTIGVMALIVVMSVMNGFRAELFDKIVGMNGHAVVQGYGGQLADWREVLREAKATPGVTEATPLIEQPLMASFEGRVEGVLLRGMERKDIVGNKTMQSKIVSGSLEALKPGSGNIALGARLAEALGANVGGQVSLISPQGRTTPFGTVPRIVSYNVAAIFEVGVYDYDKAFVVLPMEDAQTLLMLGDSVGMIKVQTVDADRVGEILDPIAAKFASKAVVQDWRSMNQSLFEALQVERVVMFCILCLIILVAAFNIFSSVIMLVRSKTRDIAILRTMGASRQGMLRIFMSIGLSIGVLGTLAGMVLGFLILYFRQSIVHGASFVTGRNMWDPSIRFVTELPSKPDAFEVILIVTLTILGAFLATLYPAWKAANTDPVQVLRYE